MWCDIDRICNQFIFYCQNQVRTYNSDAIGTSTNDQNIALSCWNSTVNNSFLISAVLLEGGGGDKGGKRDGREEKNKGKKKEKREGEGGWEDGRREGRRREKDFYAE